MYGSDCPPPDQFSPRECQVMAGLIAAKTVRQIAADLGIAPDKVKEHLQALYSKAKVHSAKELMLQHFGHEQEVADRHRLEAIRRMLEAESLPSLHLRLLMALKAWTGAGQAFLWEMIQRSHRHFELLGRSGLVYGARQDGIVAELVAKPVVVADAEAIQGEEWAVVASAEAGSSPIEGEVLALAVRNFGRRWLALTTNPPGGTFSKVAEEMALALVGMAEGRAASWDTPLPRRPPLAAAAGHNGGIKSA